MNARTKLLLVALALPAFGATYYMISDLTATTTPGDTTVIEVYDPAATPKSGKFLLTNLLQRTGTAIFVSGNYRIPLTNWVDSMVPQTAVRNGATAPTTAAFASGPATTLMFQDNRDDEVEFSVQLNHNYKQGSDISPHVHWTQTTADSGKNVVWELCSTWAGVSGAFSTWSTNYVTNAISGTAWTHQLSDFADLGGSGKTVSSILVCRLRRMANTATADNYTANVSFLGFDIHYMCDSPGSDNELTKTF